MIDFHSHILPGLDDGSKSVEESIKMLETLASQGVEKIVATPHFYANDESVEHFLKRRDNSFLKIKNELREDLPEILLGAEVRYYNGISHLKDIEKLAIGDTRLLLLEMPMSKWTEYSVDEIFQLSNYHNLIIVLAHVERYLFAQTNTIKQKLLHSDILMQSNAECFEKGLLRYKLLKLLKSGKIQLIGSDCHDLIDRKPKMNVAVNAIISKLGREFFDDLVDFQKKLFYN